MEMLKKWVGKKCSVQFDLPHTEWPIPGFPAHVFIDGVEMPLIKMRSIHAGEPMWINAKFIKSIVLF